MSQAAASTTHFWLKREAVPLTLEAVAVSVSMASFAFPSVVAELANSAGVAPQSVVLEVTESRLMSDLRAPLEILTRLRLKRFSLSIDDLGTRHSSPVQLRDIPFGELKVDQSFVHGAHANETTGQIISPV